VKVTQQVDDRDRAMNARFAFGDPEAVGFEMPNARLLDRRCLPVVLQLGKQAFRVMSNEISRDEETNQARRPRGADTACIVRAA